jgi:hypothetical protein
MNGSVICFPHDEHIDIRLIDGARIIESGEWQPLSSALCPRVVVFEEDDESVVIVVVVEDCQNPATLSSTPGEDVKESAVAAVGRK